MAKKKSPSLKPAAAKIPPAKKAAGPRRTVRLATAAIAPTRSLQVFTGTVSLDDSALTARLDGTLMSMDTSSCSRQGVIDAHTAFRGKNGQQASVQGFEWDCGEAVIHISQIL